MHKRTSAAAFIILATIVAFPSFADAQSANSAKSETRNLFNKLKRAHRDSSEWLKAFESAKMSALNEYQRNHRTSDDYGAAGEYASLEAKKAVGSGLKEDANQRHATEEICDSFNDGKFALESLSADELHDLDGFAYTETIKDQCPRLKISVYKIICKKGTGSMKSMYCEKATSR